MKSKKAIITSMGAVCSAGDNIYEILENFSFGKRKIQSPDLFSTKLDYPVFEINNIPKRFNKKKQRTLALLFWALDQALDGAQLEGLRVGVCLGTTVASQLNDIDFYKKYRETKNPSMDAVDSFLKSNLSANVSQSFNLSGPAITIVNACSSGADSIGVAVEWIRNDICDVVICGGADELSPVPYYGFASLGVVSRKPCAPFDCNREGLNLGEGAGVLILESEKSALRRKKESNVFIAGYGAAADSYHLTSPDPQGIGLEMALRSALDDVGVKKEDICFVNAHGTATRENDKVEGKTLRKVFGSNLNFFSTKGFTGHTLGAAGALEVVFTTLGLKEGWVPQSLGFKKEDDDIGISPNKVKKEIKGSYAISTSLAFGGNNIAIIVGKR